jgi:hypothetical protein
MLLPSWHVMTQNPATSSFPVEPSVVDSKSGTKKPISVEEIVQSFKSVGDDITQISKLFSEENILVVQLIDLLKQMQHIAPLIEVSPSVLPFEVGNATEAHLDAKGNLALKYKDGHQEIKDLGDIKNRDLMLAVINDVLPKFKELTISRSKLATEEPPQVKEALPSVATEPVPAVPVEAPINLPEPAPVEVPQELPQVPEIPPQPDVSAGDVKIAKITSETLGYLEMLGGEVFEQEPVSKYFDDWMVNLRQIILSFESDEAIGPDETFSTEYNRIFANIEDELAKRIANEADIAVSARTLVENRYLLNKIDEGYAAQSKEFVAKGKSTIENLMQSMQNLEKELAEVQQIKTSYRHPLQKMAKDQKIAELTQKLTAAKKRLAVAVGTSSVDKGKSGDIDSDFATQSAELEAKREVAMELLNANVNELHDRLESLKQFKTNNPIKRLSIQQEQFEVDEKLLDAKKRLEIAEKSHSDEMEKLRAEYEQKKQTAMGKVQSLEKDIATKAVDNSAGVRKEAAKALADAVKALVARKTVQTQVTDPENKSEDVPPNPQN